MVWCVCVCVCVCVWGGGASECVITSVMPQSAPPHVIAQSGCGTEELLQMNKCETLCSSSLDS